MKNAAENPLQKPASDGKLCSHTHKGDAMNHKNLRRIVLGRWTKNKAKIAPFRHARRGFDRVELVVVLVVIAVVLGLLLPAIQAAREKSRYANCVNNLKQIGLGLFNYHDARHYFPGSAEVVKTDPERPVGGWSFLFKILPSGCDYDWTLNHINPIEIKNTIHFPGAPGTLTIPLTSPGTAPVNAPQSSGKNAIAEMRDTVISEFLCPSNPNPTLENPSGGLNTGTRHAFTNYKAMCSAFAAGFMETDQYLAVPKQTSGYFGMACCDGGLYPTNSGIRISDLADGTSHTILCAETMDYSASSWIAGSDVNMVAIPTAVPPQTTDVTPTKWNNSFYVLVGESKYNGNYYEAGVAGDLVTFFSLAYGPSGKNAGQYELDPLAAPCQAGTRAGGSQGKKFQYGPSSGHPKVINCLFGDGQVRGIRKDVDAQALFFAVTRNNNDPG
jgi:type II secretory pathway pseudopilin PulG